MVRHRQPVVGLGDRAVHVVAAQHGAALVRHRPQPARSADYIVALVNSEPITNFELDTEVQRITLAAYRALGCRGVSRADFRYDDTAGEPSLTEMTLKALDILEKNETGYLLQVEAGRVDHALHAGNAYRALNDGVEFANAIAATLERVDLDETLIIVSSDHGHTLGFAQGWNLVWQDEFEGSIGPDWVAQRTLRERKSAAPPGGKFTTQRSGRDGNSGCARTARVAASRRNALTAAA